MCTAISSWSLIALMVLVPSLILFGGSSSLWHHYVNWAHVQSASHLFVCYNLFLKFDWECERFLFWWSWWLFFSFCSILDKILLWIFSECFFFFFFWKDWMISVYMFFLKWSFSCSKFVVDEFIYMAVWNSVKLLISFIDAYVVSNLFRYATVSKSFIVRAYLMSSWFVLFVWTYQV